MDENSIFPDIKILIGKLTNFDNIRPERKQELNDLAKYMRDQLLLTGNIDTIVICTHNSRRSHLGQLMLALACDHYKETGLKHYSGGTEATEFNMNMLLALKGMGFKVESISEGENPKYRIAWGIKPYQNLHPMFSKVYSDSSNPQTGFIAILVCDSADQNCPIVHGAAKRVSLPYEDPKIADGTEQVSKVYMDKIIEMGKEMFYLIQAISEV